MAKEKVFGDFILEGDGIPAGYCKCCTCGQLVPRGILNLSGHWCDCTGKDFYKALDQTYQVNNNLTIEDVDKLRDKFLNSKPS